MIDTESIFIEFVDLLMPDLSPHEASMYIFLLRHAWLDGDDGIVRIGQRSIAQKYGRGPKESVPSRAHVTRQLNSLELKGCIKIGDTNREGTLYEVILPSNIPLVQEKLATGEEPVADDYYNDPEKRNEIYERDDWRCCYCGERVTESNVSLDHYIPQHAGGTHEKDNLKTACLTCNSIKSGKSYEEAAISLLESIQTRKRRDV